MAQLAARKSPMLKMPPLMRAIRAILHGRPEHWREAAGALVHIITSDKPDVDVNGNVKWLDEPNSRLRRHTRARMKRTGESYAIARAGIICGRRDPKPKCVCGRGRGCSLHPCEGGLFVEGRCSRCGLGGAAHQVLA